MNFDAEKQGSHYDYVSGFGSLASFMASDSDHSPFVFRRFDKLAARDLLYYQSQLAQMQAEQDELDVHDRIDINSTEDGGEEHRDRIRDCVQDWKCFEQAALHSASLAQNPAVGTSSEAWKKRMDLAMRIRTTLKDYREALIQESAFLAMPTPSPQTMTAISRYFHGSAKSPNGGFAASAPYSMLSGASSSLYPPNISSSMAQIRASDYVSLSKQSEPDLLTYLLRTKLSRLFRTTPPPPTLPLYHNGRPQPTISHLSRSTIRYFSYERIRFAALFITTLAAALLLFTPIFTFYNVSASRPSLTLGLIAMFTIIFAGSLAVITNASRSEIFAACAAYSAVLVVFISGDFASGGGATDSLVA
ncbi:hypothetical protein INS49_007169 [Diaporthe citri]|uniref:uncharacterized protein n=1 Tax=Diaporthe citri TaxID=83186 RepID=UPI001C81F762|nr:uncharacterized protein INS49_007169 [Diaporthe citri]KAG6365558.1 hypothetical protein INS49_007169 [Diaporthe citri]